MPFVGEDLLGTRQPVGDGPEESGVGVIVRHCFLLLLKPAARSDHALRGHARSRALRAVSPLLHIVVRGPVGGKAQSPPAEVKDQPSALLDAVGGGSRLQVVASRGVLRQVPSQVGVEPDQAVAADHVGHESWSVGASRIGYCQQPKRAEHQPAGASG